MRPSGDHVVIYNRDHGIENLRLRGGRLGASGLSHTYACGKGGKQRQVFHLIHNSHKVRLHRVGLS